MGFVIVAGVAVEVKDVAGMNFTIAAEVEPGKDFTIVAGVEPEMDFTIAVEMQGLLS